MRKLLTPRVLTVCGFLALVVIWASATVPDNAMWLYVPWLRGNALKFLVAAAVLLLCDASCYGWKLRKLPADTALPVVLFGAANALPLLLAASWPAYLKSFWIASSGNGVVVSATMPLIFAWLYPWFDKPTLRASSWFWLFTGFVGALLLMMNALVTRWEQAIAVPTNLLELVLVGASAMWLKKRMNGVSPMLIAALQCLVMGLMLGAASLFVESGVPTQWRALASPLLEQSFGAAAIGYALYILLLQRMEAHKLALFFPAILFLNVLPFALGARLSTPWNIVCGLVLILGSLIMVLRAAAQKEESISLRSTPAEL